MTVMIGLNGAINLNDLSKGDPIYLGRGEGGLHFRECQVESGGTLRALSLVELLALALTEMCCRNGRGKVYFRGLQKAKLVVNLEGCQAVWDELMARKNHHLAHLFLAPVDEVALQIPTYYDAIKNPMDLGTVGSKLKEGKYRNAAEFETDVWLIRSNAHQFNGPNHAVSAMAEELLKKFHQEWNRNKTLVFESTHLQKALDDSDSKQNLASLPGLFYQDVEWTGNDQADWLNKSHGRRLSLLDARARICSDFSVLPIALAQSKSPQEPHTITSNTLGSILLFLNPHPQMVLKANSLPIKYHLNQVRGIPPVDLTWNELSTSGGAISTRKVKIDGVKGLVERLDQMFKEGANLAAVPIKDILEAERLILEDYEGGAAAEGRPSKRHCARSETVS